MIPYDEEQGGPLEGREGALESPDDAGPDQWQNGAPGLPRVYSGPSLTEVEKREGKAAVMRAYQRFAEDPASGQHDLWRAVIDFAAFKLDPLEWEFKDHGTTDTRDDFAQEVAIEVWSTIGAKKFSSPTKFYSWLNRLCFTKSKDAGKGLRRAVNEKAPIFLLGEDGVKRENPMLNQFSDEIDRGFTIPEWVTGTNRCICQLMLDGRDYGQIAKELDMTYPAVRQAMKRLKDEAKKRKK